MSQKISIRFFDDREVRTVWDDYAKAWNYWKYLKAKLKKEKSELGSATTQLKLLASDGKRYMTDKIGSREMLMKGVDYSYYYEGN